MVLWIIHIMVPVEKKESSPLSNTTLQSKPKFVKNSKFIPSMDACKDYCKDHKASPSPVATHLPKQEGLNITLMVYLIMMKLTMLELVE